MSMMAKPSKKGGKKWDDDDNNKPRPKGKAEKEASIPYAVVRRIMRKAGAEMVSEDAVEFAIGYIVEKIKEVTEDALRITRKNKRTKLSKDDIETVVKIKK